MCWNMRIIARVVLSVFPLVATFAKADIPAHIPFPSDIALPWLCKQIVENKRSVEDMALFSVTTGYLLLNDFDKGRLHAEKVSYQRQMDFLKPFGEDEIHWTNDSLAPLCLLGKWTSCKFQNNQLLAIPAITRCDSFINAYQGDNPLTKALFSLAHNCCSLSVLTNAFSASSVPPLDSLGVDDLINHPDATTLVVLLVVYQHHLAKNAKTLQGASAAAKANWETNVLPEIQHAWCPQERVFKFKNSSSTTFHDTCLSLIILNGLYRCGRIYSQARSPMNPTATNVVNCQIAVALVP